MGAASLLHLMTLANESASKRFVLFFFCSNDHQSTTMCCTLCHFLTSKALFVLSPHSRHSKALAAALDHKKGSSKVLDVLRTTPMVIVLKCSGLDGDNVEIVVEGFGFRQ